MNYEQTMTWGAEQYRDVLDALRECGLTAQFVQTGGMCAAIEVQLDGGAHLLLTDAEDTLSWERESHAGWYVGLYEPHETSDGRAYQARYDGPMRYLIHDDGSVSRSVDLALRVLRGEGEEGQPAQQRS